ncbi:hypothetical protein [Edaphobacter aggregans]|uniref:hypothetical protein n=1 Tax=Edaphobacter aggregans TaxID=570835 RepID=UPI000553CE89|nr:hypothetical protein [Edaphobacter aggregans]
MPRQESRIPEQRRIYQGEGSAEALVNWLNLTKDKDGKKRIAEILRLLAQLNDLPSIKDQDLTIQERTSYARFESRFSLERSLDKALAYYKMTPRIVVTNDPQRRVVARWMPLDSYRNSKKRRRAKEQTWDALPDDGITLPGALMEEPRALTSVLELAESGLVWKVQPCECGKFFFKRFSHQRFCSEKCRIADFRTSDEARRKRNEYARKLYHLHKSGKVK